MKEFDYYRVPQRSIQSIRKMVYDSHNFNPDDIDSKSEETRIREELEVEIKKIRDEMHQKTDDRMNEFENDLYEDLDIVDNPKRKKLFNKAWEMGHAYGFGEVYNMACDLVELIKD